MKRFLATLALNTRTIFPRGPGKQLDVQISRTPHPT